MFLRKHQESGKTAANSGGSLLCLLVGAHFRMSSRLWLSVDRSFGVITTPRRLGTL